MPPKRDRRGSSPHSSTSIIEKLDGFRQLGWETALLTVNGAKAPTCGSRPPEVVKGLEAAIVRPVENAFARRAAQSG